MDPSPTTTKKPSIGKTGVHLRYYKTCEYRNLSNEQKEELKEWRANNPNTFKAGSKKARKEAPKKPKPSMKKQVASLVEAPLNKSVKFDDQVNDEHHVNGSSSSQQYPAVIGVLHFDGNRWFTLTSSCSTFSTAALTYLSDAMHQPWMPSSSMTDNVAPRYISGGSILSSFNLNIACTAFKASFTLWLMARMSST